VKAADFLDSPDKMLSASAFLDAEEPPQQAQSRNTVGGVANQVLTGVVKGIPNAIDAAGALLATGAEKVTGGDRTFSDFMAGGGVLNAGVDKVLGTKDPVARTNLERYARAAGEGISSSLLTGGAGSLAELAGTTARGAASGLGSAAGGDVGEAVGGDTGRVVGSIAGGLAGSYSPEIATGATNATKAAASGVKDGVKNIAAGIGRKSAEQWGQVGDDLKAQALSTLEAANRNGTVISAPAVAKGTQDIIDSVKKSVNLTGASADELYPKTKAFLADLSSYQAGDLSLEQLHQIRQVGSSLISKAFRQGSPEDAYVLKDAVGKLDDWVSGLGKDSLTAGDPANIQTFNDFRSQYSNYARFDKVQKALEFAHGDTNKVRSTVASWFKPGNEKQLAGFSTEEKKLLEAFAFPNKAEQVLRLAGKFGINLERPDKSSVVGSLGLDSLLGIAAGLKTGGSALVGGTIAKSTANKIAQGKLETTLQALAKRK